MQSDPHQLPVFDDKTLTSSTEPIFYLPPLLSSLPEGYSHPAEDVARFKTLHTDSRLPEIDPLSLALHRALHCFSPITPEYAVTPYDKAFNWGEIRLPEEAEGEWYCVVFRSKRRPGSDSARKYFRLASQCAPQLIIMLHSSALYDADKLAHEEAVQAGGVSLRPALVSHGKRR